MPGRPRYLALEVIPAWRGFLRGLLQGRGARRLLAQGLIKTGSDDDKRFGTVYADVRAMTAADSTHYPSAQKSWQIAAALRSRVGHRFCQGPLVLYAGSHFVEFIHIMVSAHVDRKIKEVLLSTLDFAVEGATVPVLRTNRSEAYAHLEIDDSTRGDRDQWYDDEDQKSSKEIETVFEKAWLELQNEFLLPDQHDVKAAMLAATNIEASLADRRSVVRKSLLRYLDHLERMEAFKRGADPWSIPERLIGYEDALDML